MASSWLAGCRAVRLIQVQPPDIDGKHRPALQSGYHSVRFRYSLRTFLLLVTVLAVIGGTFVSRCQQQRRAVAEIERLGGTVFYDYAYRHDDHPGKSSITWNAQPPDRWLTRLLGRDVSHRVVGVWGYQQYHFAQSTSVFHPFGPVRADTEFHTHTDRSLRSLRGLRALQFLDLSETTVTDDGLAQLKSFGRIGMLRLTGTRITDRGLAVFAEMPNLSSVSLMGTDVTVEGVRTLQRSAPWLEVWHQVTTEVRDREFVLREADRRL
jgi:hypothetical protein